MELNFQKERRKQRKQRKIFKDIIAKNLPGLGKTPTYRYKNLNKLQKGQNSKNYTYMHHSQSNKNQRLTTINIEWPMKKKTAFMKEQKEEQWLTSGRNNVGRKTKFKIFLNQ